MHRRFFFLGAAAALSACVSNDPVADPGDACEIFETQEGIAANNQTSTKLVRFRFGFVGR
jgi:hypothetical protein